MQTNFKSNLLIGFGVSLTILLLSSVASYVSIRNLLDSASLVNHTNQVILELEQLMTSLKDSEAGQRGYLLTSDEQYLEHYELSRKVAAEKVELIAQLTVDNPAQQESISELRLHVGSRLGTLKEVLDIKDATGVIDIDTLNKGRILMRSVRDTVEKIEDREQELLAARTKTLTTFSRFTPALIVIAALIALIITISFYLRVSNDFKQRLQLQKDLQQRDKDISTRIDIIKNIADKIALGEYTIRVDDQQADSLGFVANSLNKMAESLQKSFGLLSEKEWMQTGIASLNDVMIGEKSVAELSRDIIEFVTTYIDGHAGAFYIYEQNDIVFAAGYAYVADASRSSFRMGEGLIGQAIATGKVMELKDVPSASVYIKFTSGEAHPKHILALPVYDGRKIKGGIEVASLSGFSDIDVEFIKSCTHSIGLALTTAQNRRRLQELLEETQSQAEELQSQHSELESINGELEIKTEKLQASEEELRVQQEELRMANQELEERSRLLEDRNQIITERNIEIQTKAEELALSARYKSEFLANMSHELRTPLNSILLLSRLMSENTQHNLTTDQIEYARVIETSGKGLLSLIDEILDLSKIESGKMELEYVNVPVRDIVRDMESLFSPVAQEKGIQFVTSVAAEVPPTIETDKMRLEQIIRNLLSNAIKFTAEGYVSMAFVIDGSDEESLNIIVKDSGIGIAKDKQQLIFEAFQQADGSTQRKYGGTGLGLSISRELVKLLAGNIHVNSELGQGSEFVVTIPLKKLSGLSSKAGKPSESTQEFIPRDVTEKKYISTTIPENIPDDRDDVTTTDKVILIVEDDTNFAKSLLEYTRQKGYKGVVAVRGDEGLSLAKQFMPLGILLDIQLPVKSGWEVMEELKADPQTRHIPVHTMSSHEVKHESLRKGAVDFIDKPVVFEKMQEVLQKIEYVLTHHPKKVLIVEENPKHASALAYFLKTFDVKLEVEDDVDGALSLLRRNDVDCVVLDMSIPNQKAYDTLEEVKKTPGFENLPIIVFTGRSLSRTEEMRIKQYADSIVVKTAHSYKRILDEVSLFLHLMEKNEAAEIGGSKYGKLNKFEDVLKGKTVLIADDDVRNIFSLTKALESYKVNVLTAIDGKDAIKQLQANPQIDIVLMDMMMPEMDGYESTAAIRKKPEFKDIPIIAVTAKAMMGDREKCINAGASDYITKPVDVDQLVSLLRVWLYERG